jgi:hypothetical protein
VAIRCFADNLILGIKVMLPLFGPVTITAFNIFVPTEVTINLVLLQIPAAESILRIHLIGEPIFKSSIWGGSEPLSAVFSSSTGTSN